MVPHPEASPQDEPHRSWTWTREQPFKALSFYRRGWEILRQDWLVFLWKVLADLVGRGAFLLLGMVLLTLFLVDFELFTAAGYPFWTWPAHLLPILSSPAFIAGLVGAVFFSALAGIATDALVTGGIWGLLARGLSGQPIERGKTFTAALLERFPEVLSLFLLKSAVQLVSGCLGMALAIAFIQAGTTGALMRMNPAALTLLMAGSLTIYIAWMALTRLTLEAIGVPLILDEVPLGEAILRGASFVVDNFVAVYRLLIFYLGLLFIPLTVYWLLLMTQNLLLFVPELAILGTLVRGVGEIFLWLSLSVLGVVFHGALFAFYHCDDSQVSIGALPGEPAGAEEEKPLFHRGTTLQELLPEESPFRFSFEEALPDVAAEPEDKPELARDDEQPDGQTRRDGKDEPDESDELDEP